MAINWTQTLAALARRVPGTVDGAVRLVAGATRMLAQLTAEHHELLIASALVEQHSGTLSALVDCWVATFAGPFRRSGAACWSLFSGPRTRKERAERIDLLNQARRLTGTDLTTPGAADLLTRWAEQAPLLPVLLRIPCWVTADNEAIASYLRTHLTDPPAAAVLHPATDPDLRPTGGSISRPVKGHPMITWQLTSTTNGGESLTVAFPGRRRSDRREQSSNVPPTAHPRADRPPTRTPCATCSPRTPAARDMRKLSERVSDQNEVILFDGDPLHNALSRHLTRLIVSGDQSYPRLHRLVRHSRFGPSDCQSVQLPGPAPNSCCACH